MGFDDIVTTGLAALFGGALLWAAIGALVGRFQGFDVGVATGMILFGLTGLVFAAWLAWILWGPGADMELGPSQIGMVGVFGAFGGFGALGGCVVLASELEKRRARPAQPVSRARTGASRRVPSFNSTNAVEPERRKVPGRKFMAGEPMKPATNWLAGWS